MQEQLISPTTNIDSYTKWLCLDTSMPTYVSMKRGFSFVQVIHFFVNPNYTENGEYQNCLMGIIGYCLDNNTPPVIKIISNLPKCRFHNTPSLEEIELSQFHKKGLKLVSGGY